MYITFRKIVVFVYWVMTIYGFYSLNDCKNNYFYVWPYQKNTESKSDCYHNHGDPNYGGLVRPGIIVSR